ncbi:MAG: hypothetical protein Fur0042_12640 [Cyanophyceae cyanobacterium]
MDEPKEIHWSDIHGNPLLRRLHPQMIMGTYLELKVAVIKGTGTKNGGAAKVQLKVVYDRSFAIAKLVMILCPLKKLSRSAVERLISDSLDVIYSEEGSDGES